MRRGQHGHPSSLNAAYRLEQPNAPQNLGAPATADWAPLGPPECRLKPSRIFGAFELLGLCGSPRARERELSAGPNFGRLADVALVAVAVQGGVGLLLLLAAKSRSSPAL
eukprot:6138415-Alexandrium_andersonii.AAC.1